MILVKKPVYKRLRCKLDTLPRRRVIMPYISSVSRRKRPDGMAKSIDIIQRIAKEANEKSGLTEKQIRKMLGIKRYESDKLSD